MLQQTLENVEKLLTALGVGNVQVYQTVFDKHRSSSITMPFLHLDFHFSTVAPELEFRRQTLLLSVGDNITLEAPLRNTPFPPPRVIWAYQAPDTRFVNVAEYVVGDGERPSVNLGHIEASESGKYAVYIFNSAGGAVAILQVQITCKFDLVILCNTIITELSIQVWGDSTTVINTVFNLVFYMKCVF